MSTSPSPVLKIPQSANSKYHPLKLLGGGKDGDVALAVPRAGIQNLDLCVALKILKGDNTTSVPRRKLEKLVDMEDNVDHLIAAVRDYSKIDQPEWHCMSYIPGYSIEYLLDKKYGEHGMPPTLVFHVFIELVRVQDHLRANELTHTDLRAGGNVMLSNKDNDAWPSVTLVDFSGIRSYDQSREVRHIVQLVAKMTKFEETIPKDWSLSSFEDNDIEAANKIYEMIRSRANRKTEEGEHLTELWRECGKRVEQLKQSLKDNMVLGDLRDTLNHAKTTDADVQKLLGKPAVTIDVMKYDAGWEAANS
jgi:serine/threonine protein kinase